MSASPEAIREAGEVYAAILSDPDRARQIRAGREKYDAEQAALAAAEASEQRAS